MAIPATTSALEASHATTGTVHSGRLGAEPASTSAVIGCRVAAVTAPPILALRTCRAADNGGAGNGGAGRQAAAASSTSSADGLTKKRPPMRTVGTISSPPVAVRTTSA